ncbi:putative glucose-6-phosphate 1-dehydrogenase, cytoplasmic isoform isoform X1 [Capsicum annuum]|uniref:U4/U6 small nuclear ribonucleoprotein Prp31 homolog n=1 Tax=Capsicum annuum TaxID=4072 RepID=UPI001FB10EA6|nr:U4/U6 small nuclear ribonucleoprotein Prp31 homolog [Capsicum annuum]KAF3656568.1 putative glucose-6-phosphate 1-dehydrogenase, cytoplasmic isoform isoform X1 [Capsicum annuum]
MTTLADSFLADLDELDDNTIDVHLHMEEDKYENLVFNYHDDYDLDDFLKLQKSRHYIDTMQKVEHSLIFANKGDVLLEYDDPEYKLIVDCNALSVDIDDEIDVIHDFIRDKYRLKFPELDSLVNHPIDYARVVKKIGDEMDLTLVDLQGLLPSAVIMVVTVTASTTNGKPLPERVLERTLEECDRILDLDSSKKKVVDFVESRMKCIAPNLCGVVGSAVAAKLVCCAGGLMLSANMPSDNIRCLGARRKNLAGFSKASTPRFCYFDETDIFQSTPPSLRGKVRKILADKCSLAARVDLSKTGRIDFKEKICKKIEKLQELPPARLPKALPVPDFTSRKK